MTIRFVQINHFIRSTTTMHHRLLHSVVGSGLGVGSVAQGVRAAPASAPASAPAARLGGTGPGAITPDGCSVEHYAMLQPMGEPELVHSAITAFRLGRSGGPGASILELGAGAGRVTHGLVALGHSVVAVDESAEMLARIDRQAGARNGVTVETVCQPIQDLALGRTFDVVLLMSYLIDTIDVALRPAFLRVCRDHLAPHGCLIIQRQPPEWYDSVRPFERTTADGSRIQLAELDRLSPDQLAITMAYTVGDRRWTHSFLSTRVDDALLHQLLAGAGLVFSEFIGGHRSWIRAVPSMLSAQR